MVMSAFGNEIKREKKRKMVIIRGVGCLGPFAVAPLIGVSPPGVVYQAVEASDAPDI